MKRKVILNILVGMGMLVAAFPVVTAPSALAAPDAATWYVIAGTSGGCTSWQDACDLQAALDKSSSGDQIWVAAGTYKPTTPAGRFATFQLKGGVSLYGGYNSADGSRDWQSNTTILDGDIGVAGDPADNSYHVVTAMNLTSWTVLDGFTIQNGNANYASSHWAWGGGLYAENSALGVQSIVFTSNTANGGGGMFTYGATNSPILTGVYFTGNHANINGGGLHTYNGSRPYLSGVTFTDNTAVSLGGGMVNSGASPMMTGVEFINNSAYTGGGMYSYSSSPVLGMTTFISNTATQDGGGMYNTGSRAVMTYTLFLHNSANYGGGLYNNSSSDAKVTDALFTGNSATTQGGGTYNYSSSPTFFNVTFSGNSAGTNGGQAMCSYYSYPNYRNSILWGNGSPGQAQVVNASSTTSYIASDIQGSGGSLAWNTALGTDGGGNIDLDPLFVDPDGPDNTLGTPDDNLRLSLDSPVADTGNNTYAAFPSDLDGNPRIRNGKVDMGAYEFIYPQPPAIIYVDWAASGGRNGGNWADALQNLYFALAWAKAGVADYAMPGVEIRVAQGRYKPAFSKDRYFYFELTNGVSLYGGFNSADGSRDWVNFPTILDGDLLGNDGANFANNGENSYHVVSAIGITTKAVLDGFWIMHGNADLQNNLPWEWGGGLYTENSDLDVRKVVFTYNSARGGGGMFSNGGQQPLSLDNVQFIANRALVNGGGLHIYNGSSPTLAHVDFSANTVTGGGGGIYSINSSATLSDVTFDYNTATRGGGMADFNSYSTIGNSTFTNNTASLDGGGYYDNNDHPLAGHLSITNTDFYTNTAGSTGGGAHLFYSVGATLTDVTFSGNKSTNAGGGLLNWNAGAQLTKVTFNKNESTNLNGGGMFNQTATSSLSDVHFTANKAKLNGGGLYNTASNPTLSSVTFTGNIATTSNGGGMYNDANPNMTDVRFENNQAVGGGGMYNNTNSSPTLADVTFDHNTATQSGGGMGNFASAPGLTGVNFINNSAAIDGGGMVNFSCYPTLTNVTFSGNTATNSGGGMVNYGGSATLADVTFSGNTATFDGGGMYNNVGSSPSLTVVEFITNTAVRNGGGMYNLSSSPVLSSTQFTGNSASTGGGMYNDISTPVLVRASFDGNTASQSGGGIYNNGSSPTILQTVFYTNTAVVSGGGMFNGGCTALVYPAMANVLFNNNSATGSGNNGNGGGLYNDNCPAMLVNVTFFYNHAVVYGGGVFENGGTPLKLRNSLLWGNTGAGTTYDNQFVGSKAEVKNTTMQGSDTDPSPFVNANGADGIPGNRDDDLHPTYPSGKIIDGGLESDLPPDIYDLDGDGITTNELLPVDLDGGPRIYADNDGDGNCDPVATLETDLLDQVDQGAYEAGCWAWHMKTGNKYLVEGRDYRLGFHNEINGPATITISDTLVSYAQKRAEINLKGARTNFELAAQCAGNTVTQTNQATKGMLDAIWELATADMLQGNEEMVQALDVSNSQGSYSADIAKITSARDFYNAAVKGYLEPIASQNFDQLLETLAISRTSPLTYTVNTSLVDLQRLVMASSLKSRANLELAEHQFRNNQNADAKQTLEDGQFQAHLEMSLVEFLWPEVVDTVDYADLVRSLGDMDRMHGYIVSGKNPFGYDPDYIPFSFNWKYPDLNNFIQSWTLADKDLKNAKDAITTAANKQKEIDDNYVTMQTNLQAAQDQYNSTVGTLCGWVEVSPGVFEPDREHCSGGSIQEQQDVVDNAMLAIDRVLTQMENQNALIKIEQDRVAAEKNIHYATAQLITETGEQIATLEKQKQEVDVDKSTWGGIKAFVKGAISGARPLGVATPKLSYGKTLLGGLLGGTAGVMDWQAQNARAEKLGDIDYQEAQLRAKQEARIEYAEAQIADANSEAVQKQYMLKFAELDIDLAMAINNLEKELAHLVNLENQAQYALAEYEKAQAFSTLLYRDPAGRVLRENYMEMAHASYEIALEAAYKAGKALEYEINNTVVYPAGGPLHKLSDIYPLEDTFFLTQALNQIDNAYDNWTPGNYGTGTTDAYLSLALGFVDTPMVGTPTSTKEDKFHAFVNNPSNIYTNTNGCPVLSFNFQTSNQPGNLLLLPINTYNDRIDSIEMRIYAYNKTEGLFYGAEQENATSIRLTQGGTSVLRTSNSRIYQLGGDDDLRTYNLEPKSIVIDAINDSFTGTRLHPPQPNIEMRGRSPASTEWAIEIQGGMGYQCGNVNLGNIGDILLIIHRQFYGLSYSQADANAGEASTIHEPRPGQSAPTSYPEYALSTSAEDMPLAVSADNDLNGTFVGTVAITLPNYLPSSDLVLQLSDVGGSLTGYISPTLAYPTDPATGHGPALTGSWSGNHFTLQSQPFVTHVSQDITITRTLKFQTGVISTTQTTRFLSGVYVETLAGLTPQPLEMRGVFQVQRPLRLLQAGFDASPKVVSTGDNVFFSDLSVGNPTSWSWSFGDGGTSTQQNPVHHYTALGDYTVSLTVSDGSGSNKLTKTGFISVISSNTKPTAGFSASPLEGPAPLTVNFVDHSVGGATSWLWNFGDGKTSTQQNPTHVYMLPGKYTVSLTASNSHGSDTFTWDAYITVTGTPPKRIYLPLVKR